ncbi:hypothetical protein C5F47_06050 [Nitrosopumilus cobalaminigenes]|uniref:Uncharacterized protein n=2 Tax=Nitrosopumilus cobalaminigenes TaxID=1470066 RepID=A0A7D5R721_9ARCH|nr:hypothetical protein C5F47_06050 [Nitrosopumilus cobalaminigenes]
MFVGVIVVAIIMLVVLLIVVASQQMQINEINRQDILEVELTKCSFIIANSNPFSMDSQNQAEIEWENCFTAAIEEHGNDEQKLQWENSQVEKQQNQENKNEMAILMIQDCRQKYIGQIQEMNDCLDDVEFFRYMP